MGGVQCKHRNTKVIEKCDTYNRALAWTQEVVKVECEDCGEKFKVERCVGNLTGLTYSQNTDISQETCTHERFEVDQYTIEEATEKNAVSCAWDILTGGGWAGGMDHKYWKAHAKCKRCEHEFWVRSEFDREWKNKQVVEKRATPWVPVTISKKVETKDIYKDIPMPITYST